jgi:sorbitol-specific phosphotransferase system component IIA
MTARSTADALDFARFDAIEQYADLAASYWRSVAEAASRGEGLTIEVHCKQIAAVTREAFATVRELGSSEKATAA